MVYTPVLVFGHGMPVMSEEDSIVEMMRKFLYQMTFTDKSARRGSLESGEDFIKERNSPSLCFEPSLEYEDALLQRNVLREIERCLSNAKASTLRCQVLLLPRRLTAKVARDVVRSSADEPCGLRGASISVYLDRKEGLLSLGTISPDPGVTPIFELSVVFKVDNDGWPPLKHIFVNDKVLKLRPEYRLVKKKFYSSASPVICDY